jgi:hypothetical protein
MSGTDLHCYEYKNVPPSELAVLTSSCTGTQGTGCPGANLSGCCTLPSEGGGMTTEVCYYAPIDPVQGQTACNTQSGTWATAP